MRNPLPVLVTAALCLALCTPCLASLHQEPISSLDPTGEPRAGALEAAGEPARFAAFDQDPDDFGPPVLREEEASFVPRAGEEDASLDPTDELGEPAAGAPDAAEEGLEHVALED